MRNIRTIRVSQLNIVMDNPHSPQRYVDLFSAAKKINPMVRLRGDEAAKLGPVDIKKSNAGNGYITGDIYRFLNIDESAEWFNTEKNLPATDDETDEINIPAALRPNLKMIEFVFRPKSHRLYFVNKDRKHSMTPQQAEKFFQALFDIICSRQDFPAVTVTAIPESNSIDALFSIPVLRKIEIKLARPNPDDFDIAERRILRRLEKINAKKIETNIIAQPGESLEPDEEIRTLAEVAAQNGSVVASGLDGHGKKVIESTKDRPIDEPYTVDSEIEDSGAVLLRVSESKAV